MKMTEWNFLYELKVHRIKESDRADLLGSSSGVGEQVGSVGSHYSLKAPRKKPKMAVESEDADTSKND